MSLNDEHFKQFITLWMQSGWWVAIVASVGWLGYSVKTHREKPLRRIEGPSWSLTLACAAVTFIFGCIWAATSSGGIPQLISSHSTNSCDAVIDTTKILIFKDKYKIGLVCYASSPLQDPLTDKNIAVSNLFTITPGPIAMKAMDGPGASPPQTIPQNPVQPVAQPVSQPVPRTQQEHPQQTTPQGTPPLIVSMQQVEIHFLPILVPKDVPREKITTLSDLEALGGKVIDSRYYN